MAHAKRKDSLFNKIQRAALGGLMPGTYASIRPELGEKNLKTLVNASGIATAVLILLILASFFVPAISANRALYIVSALIMIVIFALAQLWCKKKPRRVMPLWYIFYFFVMAFAGMLGVAVPDIPATTFCVLIFALPLVFTDAPYRITILIAVCTAIFCIAVSQLKAPTAASLDMVNSISFCILSIGVNYFMARIKLNDVVRRITITKQRDTDSLSGVLSREATEMAIQQHLEQGSDPAAFAVIDADNFKAINDTHGHECGDRVIQSLAARMQAIFRQGDIIGRYGGDEFIVFMTQVENPEDIDIKMEELVDACRRPIQTPDGPLHVQVSAGIALYPLHGRTYSALFNKADDALYQAKNLGKDQHVIAV